MKKIILSLFLLVVYGMTAFAQDSVTFQVNMKLQSIIKKFDPAVDSVFIRGNFYQGTGNWWETNSMKLADADGDSIYSGTFNIGVGAAPKRITAYKFIVRGATYGGDHWEYGSDRSDTIPSAPYTLDVKWFDRDSTSVYFANDVTFRVNMKYRIEKGFFNAATDSVVVRGEFNGWGGKKHVLADADNDSIYTGTFSIPSWTFLKYKFVKIGPTGDGWESSPDRLIENVTGPTTDIPVVYFNNANFANGSVTFRVNMKAQSKQKKFDPALDSVFIRGNFYQGTGNWWETNSMKLSDANGDSIYEGTFNVGAVPRKITAYKYIVRGPSYGGDHWEYGGDRSDTVPTTPYTMFVRWFDHDSTGAYFANDVTFQVNMKYRIKLGFFNKATDSVVVRGEFNGWGGKKHLLLDADGDSIYTGTFSIPSWTWLKYKFVKIGPGGDGWESSPDRLVENLTGPTTTLPIAFFNNYDAANGMVTFRVNMKAQSKQKKFDPAKDSVFIRGNFYQGAGNWWESNAMKLSDANGDSIYEGTFAVGAIPKKITAYKYVVRGASYGGDHWEYGGDRSDTVPTTPYTMYVRWFDHDSTGAYFANDVTFRVNMKKRILTGAFNKTTDSVVVRGEFNGWGGKKHLLADADGDSIYTGTHNIPSWTWLKYKFVKIGGTGEGWESSDDRLIQNLTGPTTSLPTVWFNNDSVLTGVNGKGAVALKYELNQNYPNPFNPTTTINYSIEKTGLVSLKVFNILGQEVATLVNGELEAGQHVALFDASSLSSGVYFYKLESGSFSSLKKMMILK